MGPIGTILGCLFGVAAGGFLFRRGARGKLISDHPFCRKCDYDLFGRAPDSTRCPECGQDLSQRRAIVQGKRKRRLLVSTLGILLIAASLYTSYKSSVYPLVFGAPDQRLTWVLLVNARNAGSINAVPAILELLNREALNELSPRQRRMLARAMLDHPGGWVALGTPPMRLPKPKVWPADVFERSHNEGWLSDADYQRYWQQSFVATLQIRPLVNLGDPVPIRVVVYYRGSSRPLVVGAARRDLSLFGNRRATATLTAAEMDGIQCNDLPELGQVVFGLGSKASQEGLIRQPEGIKIKPPLAFISSATSSAVRDSATPVPAVTFAPPAPATSSTFLPNLVPAPTNRLKVTMQVTVEEDTGDDTVPLKTLARVTIDNAGDFQLLPRDSQPIQLRTGATGFRHEEIGTPRLWWNDWPDPAADGSSPERELWVTFERQTPAGTISFPGGRISAPGTPAAISGRVIAQANGATVSGGQSHLFNHSTAQDAHVNLGPVTANADSLDVSVLPDPRLAITTLNLFDIWGEPLTFKSLPLNALTRSESISRAALREFWTGGHHAMVAAVSRNVSYDAKSNTSTGEIRIVALLAGDLQVGGKTWLRVRKGGVFFQDSMALLVLEPSENSDYDMQAGASDYGFLPIVNLLESRSAGSGFLLRTMDPIPIEGLSDLFLRKELQIVRLMRTAGDEPILPSTRPNLEPVINDLQREMSARIAVTDPVKSWEGDGRPALLLGMLRQISRRENASRANAILHPLFCLAGRFDPSVYEKLPVSFAIGEQSASLSTAPPEGAMVLAVIRVFDGDPRAVYGVIASEPCPFIPGGTPMLTVRGPADPRVGLTIMKLLGP